MFWGWFVGYSVSAIIHENNFLFDFVSFLTFLLLLYSKLFVFLSFFKFHWNVFFLDFNLHFIYLFVHGESLASSVTTLHLTKLFNYFICFSTFVLENNLFESILLNRAWTVIFVIPSRSLVTWRISYLQVKFDICGLMMTTIMNWRLNSAVY